MKKLAIALVVAILIGAVVYVLGPVPTAFVPSPLLPTLNLKLDDIDPWVAQREAAHRTLKPGNGAEVVWADSVPSRTPYVMVYLHGFSASKFEANDVHRPLAREFGCNLYLPRMVGHGLDTVDAMAAITAENYLNSAKEALALAKLMGDSIILICCSTGATHGLYLAAHHPEISGLILYSPNIELAVPGASLIVKPWGMKLACAITGGDEYCFEADAEFKKYWTSCYKLEGILAVQQTVSGLMTRETFNAVKQPVFLGYFYKDAVEQDRVVSVAAMREMFTLLGTPPHKKVDMPFPNAREHVICSPLRSGDLDGVIRETRTFAAQILGLRPRAKLHE